MQAFRRSENCSNHVPPTAAEPCRAEITRGLFVRVCLARNHYNHVRLISDHSLSSTGAPIGRSVAMTSLGSVDYGIVGQCAPLQNKWHLNWKHTQSLPPLSVSAHGRRA